MHTSQSKHTKLKEKEILEVLEKFNVSKAQLPKILSGDSALSEDCEVGDVVRIERIEKDSDSEKSPKEEKRIYYRVVV